MLLLKDGKIVKEMQGLHANKKNQICPHCGANIQIKDDICPTCKKPIYATDELFST
jgi:predicted amidophosphoribosyltransferase